MANNEGMGGEPPSGVLEDSQAAPRSVGETERSPWVEEAQKRFGRPLVGAVTAPTSSGPRQFKISEHAILGLGGRDAFYDEPSVE